MKHYTTLSHVKWLFDFWFYVGVSPLKLQEYNEVQTPQTTDEKAPPKEKLINLTVSKNVTKEQILYKVESWNSGSWKFFFITIFCTMSLMFSLTRLSYILSCKDYELFMRIASILLAVYTFASFLITMVHISKAKAICDFLWQWQSFEAEFYKG